MRVIVRGAALALSVALCGPAMARDAQNNGIDGVEGYIALGAGYLPDYDGSKHYEFLPYAEARANIGNYYARFDGGSFRINLVDSDTWHAGPLIGIRRGRDEVDSAAVSRLQHIDDTATAGGFLEYEHVADDPRSGESVVLTFDDAAVGNGNGWTAILRGEVRRPVNVIDPGLIASIEGDVDWGDGQFMQTYFGVDAPGAIASGLPLYHASSGLESLGAAFSLDQFLSPHWGVGVRFHYARMMDAAADSPITAVAGSPDQFFVGLAISYVL